MQNRSPCIDHSRWAHNAFTEKLQEKGKTGDRHGWVTALGDHGQPLDGAEGPDAVGIHLSALVLPTMESYRGLGMRSKRGGRYTNFSYHSTRGLFPTNDN